MESQKNVADFCILGAGIAGLSMADALQEKGYKVIVLEKNGIASGASGSPGALVNPATGRRAKKSWKAETCYHAISQNLQKVSAYSNKSFYWNTGVLRPALSKPMALKMREHFEKTTWHVGWCQWQNERQIKNRHSGINCVDGGLWLPVGLTVNAAAYLQQYSHYLWSQNVLIKTKCDYTINHTGNSWRIYAKKFDIKCKHLIYAIGLSAVDHPWWFHLPLEAVKGQVARFKAPEELLSFKHSISSLGYIAKTNKRNEFIQGSTYEHDFTHLKPDVEGEQYLRQRLARTLPELASKVQIIDQWSGVRVTTPDKKPVLGQHPEISNLHIFTALGSKGLLYGKFLAEHYADHLNSSKEIYPEVDIGRFQ